MSAETPARGSATLPRCQMDIEATDVLEIAPRFPPVTTVARSDSRPLERLCSPPGSDAGRCLSHEARARPSKTGFVACINLTYCSAYGR